MKFKIPKQFNIMAHTITVSLDDDIALDDHRWGEINYNKGTIKLSQELASKKFPKSKVKDTFWHEVIHAILFYMDEAELNSNEDFISRFAYALNQVVESMDGDLLKDGK